MRIDVYHHFIGVPDEVLHTLRGIAAQNEALLTGQRDLGNQFTSFQETVRKMLNANEKAIVEAFNTTTTNMGEAVALGVKAITDLFNNQSSITLADVQPSLDSLNTAAEALRKTATEADPAVNPEATPIVVTTPDGTTVPTTESPV